MTTEPIFHCVVLSCISFLALACFMFLYSEFCECVERWYWFKHGSSKWKMVVYYIIDIGFVVLIVTIDLLTVLSFFSLMWNIIQRFW